MADGTATMTMPSGKIEISGDSPFILDVIAVLTKHYMERWIDDQVAKGMSREEATAAADADLRRAYQEVSERIEAAKA